MKNFWIEFGLSSGIAVVSAIVAMKVKNPDLAAAAEKCLADLHELMDAWHLNKG